MHGCLIACESKGVMAIAAVLSLLFLPMLPIPCTFLLPPSASPPPPILPSVQVWVGVIVAYIFTWIPDWTSWVLLVFMALYDIAAVLIPGGPLKVWMCECVAECKGRDETKGRSAMQTPLSTLLYRVALPSSPNT